MRGYSEVNVNNTYASVLGAVTIRLLLAYAAAKRLHVRHLDVTAAFLHSSVESDIYVEQPHGMERGDGLVYKLKKALYRLRIAPRR